MLSIATMVRIIISILLFISFKSEAQIPLWHAHNYTIANLPLDNFPFSLGVWSVRREITTYTGPLMNVRRTSDNTEVDIGYTINGDLDTAALKTFVGANSGFVRIWYDQSGNNRHMTQGTTTTQPRIVNAGVVERLGVKPSLYFDGSNDFLQMAVNDTINIVNVDWSTYIVQKRRTGGVIGGILSGASAGNLLQTQWSDNNFYIQGVPSTATNGAVYRTASDNTSAFSVIEAYNVSNTLSAYKNNTAYSLSSALNFTTNQRTLQQIGRYGNLAFYTDGYISSVYHWNLNQTANRATIVSNINTYFSIY